jgi:hypothetical protein
VRLWLILEDTVDGFLGHTLFAPRLDNLQRLHVMLTGIPSARYLHHASADMAVCCLQVPSGAAGPQRAHSGHAPSLPSLGNKGAAGSLAASLRSGE